MKPATFGLRLRPPTRALTIDTSDNQGSLTDRPKCEDTALRTLAITPHASDKRVVKTPRGPPAPTKANLTMLKDKPPPSSSS